MSITKKIKKVLNFLFPINLTCNVCGREIFSGEYFCEECKSQLPTNNKEICKHCGRKVLNSAEYCLSCKGRETHFEKARSVFSYESPVNRLITALKYDGKQYLANVFSKYMALLYFENYYNCDLAVAVPMSEERLKARGYNQAELLAERICERVDIPYEKNVLIKYRETQRQTGLDAKNRAENLKGSFKIENSEKIKGKRVLLVDDIMTTGATVEYLSSLLLKKGAESVLVLTVASVSKEDVFAKKQKSA